MTRAAEGFECVSSTITPSSPSMFAVLQFTLYAGAATAAHTPSATFLISNFASPPPAPSCPQQSISPLLVTHRTAAYDGPRAPQRFPHRIATHLFTRSAPSSRMLVHPK